MKWPWVDEATRPTIVYRVELRQGCTPKGLFRGLVWGVFGFYRFGLQGSWFRRVKATRLSG